jgi:hypothetical protein
VSDGFACVRLHAYIMFDSPGNGRWRRESAPFRGEGTVAARSEPGGVARPLLQAWGTDTRESAHEDRGGPSDPSCPPLPGGVQEVRP